ncbi:hypothetical protein J8281_08615 [Aquimarina sp. U1-2]|uniref:MauE/DoxX family redox-associated membrane protein n=1 Tax=Aquimarina sp. U1-2 TaxID=2823141 RepID=UPI001AECC3CD|nr:hypothetical protein [Aquimarina sp. U1-2]MBP2832246.1 hypothetical protein [Aquimarina sp. U1-2]
MKLKILLFNLLRLCLGIFLVTTSINDVLNYTDFLGRLYQYFASVSILDIYVVEALAPLVPFEKFMIGLFLILGMSEHIMLRIAIFLFSFFTVYLIDASQWYCAGIHFLLVVSAIVLIKIRPDHFTTAVRLD